MFAKSISFESIRIVAFATMAAIAYGIIHDQVTAHICVEYFTIAHPPVFATESPFLLALGWGIIATWWVGLTLGIGLAAAARMGPARKLGLSELRRPIIVVMTASAISAGLAGVTGAVLVAYGAAPVPGSWEAMIPADKHIAFTAVAWAHAASYTVGALSGVLVIVQTLRRRMRSRWQ